MWHVSSRSGVATLYALVTYLLPPPTPQLAATRPPGSQSQNHVTIRINASAAAAAVYDTIRYEMLV